MGRADDRGDLGVTASAAERAGTAHPTTIGVGIVGTGVMGADHAATLDRFVSGAGVTRVTDLDVDRAREVAASLHGAHVSRDPQSLIDDPAVDAVVIASADATHADFVRACVHAGKPVLCEKPLAASSAEAATLLRDIGPAGEQLLSVGFMRRFDPGYVQLRAIIADRRLGAPVLVHSVSRGVASSAGASTASAITNSAIHDLDIVPWLLGSPVTEVSWHSGRRPSELDGLVDPQFILLRTADGVLSTVELFLNARYGYDIRAEVVCKHGAATLAEPVRILTDTQLTRAMPYAADWRPRFADAYRLELQAWVDSLTGRVVTGGPANCAALATGRDALAANAVADAVIASLGAVGATIPVRRPEL